MRAIAHISIHCARRTGRAPRFLLLSLGVVGARQVLRDGCARARAAATATLEEVRDAMGMCY
jgi:hypothetical protein